MAGQARTRGVVRGVEAGSGNATLTGSRIAGQRAFVGLLSRPLITASSDPELYRAVIRNIDHVVTSARQLGYRVQQVHRVVRLVRIPVDGTLAHPTPPLDHPGRRVMSLACLLAVACEESPVVTTLARLSQLVIQLSAQANVAPYDQAQVTHRRALKRAADLLEHWGVLTRITADDAQVEAWAAQGEGYGAGYQVDRSALLMLTSPDVIAAAGPLLDGDDHGSRAGAAGVPGPAASTETTETTGTTEAAEASDAAASTGSSGMRALRSLVETPAVLYADLAAGDRESLQQTRGLRANDAVRITGGHVESRAEGLVLVLPDDPPSPATVNWPRAAAAEWVALLMLDLASRAGERDSDGAVHLDNDQVADVVEDLQSWRGEYMSKALREEPGRIREEAERWLTYLGLLRCDASGWHLLPVAGRYRDPEVVRPSGPVTPAHVDDEADADSDADSEVDADAGSEAEMDDSTQEWPR